MLEYTTPCETALAYIVPRYGAVDCYKLTLPDFTAVTYWHASNSNCVYVDCVGPYTINNTELYEFIKILWKDFRQKKYIQWLRSLREISPQLPSDVVKYTGDMLYLMTQELTPDIGHQITI